MKISFWGTSHGVPSATRYCSGNVLEINGATYLIDGGAPMADLCLRHSASIASIRASFTTHMHGDHTWGLFHLLDLINWKWTDTKLKVFLPEQTGIDALRVMEEVVCHPFDESRIGLTLVSEGLVYQDENIRVTAIPTQHMPDHRPSYAYFIEAEGKRILFTGDMHPDMDDFPQIALEQHFDCILCEAAHQPAQTTLEKARLCSCSHFLITHVYPDEKFDIFRKAEKDFPFDFHTVDDGDSITL